MQIKAFGTNYDETVAIAQVPVPEPGPGEALVRINCRPVNPADVFSVMGVYPGFVPKGMPAVPGLEGAWLGYEHWGWGPASTVTGQRRGEQGREEL